MAEAEIAQDGAVTVEGQRIGELQGFCFVPGGSANSDEAAAKAIEAVIVSRAQQLAEAANDQFIFASDGAIRWRGHEVAKLQPGESEIEPDIRLLADPQLAGAYREWAEARIKAFVRHHISQLLKPLFDLRAAQTLETPARSIAFQLVEAMGVLERSKVASEVKSLEQPVRANMRALGVRFGAHHIYLPAILKPKPRALAAQLWLLKNGEASSDVLRDLPQLALSGRTTLPVDANVLPKAYRILGYKILGTRAVRIDILERLADLIRPILSYREGLAQTPPPKGWLERHEFVATVDMTSLLGCSGEDFSAILRALGYVNETRPRAEIEAKMKTLQEAITAKPPAAPAVEVAAQEDPSLPAGEAAPEMPAPAEQVPQASPEQAAAPPSVAETIDVWRLARPERKFKPRSARKPQAAAGENRLENKTQAERKPYRKKFDKTKNREAEKGEPRPGEKRPFRRHAKGDRKDRNREQMSERRLVFSTEAPQKDKGADPDNPFAKLAALKAQMDREKA